MRKAYIYAIVNKITGNMYIGSAFETERRFSEHKRLLKKGTHVCSKLQNGWNKHGGENFEFKILKETNHDNRNKDEQEYMDIYGYYNMAKTVCYSHPKYPKVHVKIPVHQFDLEGNLIKIWDDAVEAHLHYTGRRKMGQFNKAERCHESYKGFMWSYDGIFHEPPKDRSTKVDLYKNDDFIQTFKNINLVTEYLTLTGITYTPASVAHHLKSGKIFKDGFRLEYHGDEYKQNHDKISVYNTEREKIGDFDTLKEFNEQFNTNIHWKPNFPFKGGKYHFFKIDSTIEDVNNYFEKIEENKVYKHQHNIIYQFDRKGELIGNFKTVAEACRTLNQKDNSTSTISRAIQNKRLAFGYFWNYEPTFVKKEGYITGYEVYKDGEFIFEELEIIKIAERIKKDDVKAQWMGKLISTAIKLNQPTPCGHTFKVLY
jgi:group I intron endonuclease